MTEGTSEQDRGIGRMRRRAAGWVAWSLCATALILLMAGMAVSYLLRRAAPDLAEIPLWLEMLFVLGFAIYSTVGAIVASRRPGNAVGWLLCAVGLAIAAVSFTEPYTLYAREVPAGSLPGAGIAAFLDTVNPGVRLAIFIPLIFPDGRLPSRRWRPVAWLAGGSIVLSVLSEWALRWGGTNLLGIELPDGVFETASDVALVLLVAGFLGAMASVVHRLRRARGTERQQIKWLVYPGSLMMIGALGSMGSVWFSFSRWPGFFWWVTLFGFATIPVAVGIAILRHRLYDIDVVINRTLVYGSLTTILVGVYFGGVTATQALFRILTGQEEQPQLVVVASTLVIAALFNPLRGRIQSFIDRRFYRRRYDARKTLEAFSIKLREETDLDALNDNLVGVVRETMQPAHATLWLRPSTLPKGEEA